MSTQIVIRDPAVLTKLKEKAAEAGRTDWRVAAQEAFDVAIKIVLGVRVDLTVKEAAALQGCHPNTIKNYHRWGKLPNAYYTSQRRLMVPSTDLAMLKNNKVAVH